MVSTQEIMEFAQRVAHSYDTNPNFRCAMDDAAKRQAAQEDERFFDAYTSSMPICICCGETNVGFLEAQCGYCERSWGPMEALDGIPLRHVDLYGLDLSYVDYVDDESTKPVLSSAIEDFSVAIFALRLAGEL